MPHFRVLRFGLVLADVEATASSDPFLETSTALFFAFEASESSLASSAAARPRLRVSTKKSNQLL